MANGHNVTPDLCRISDDLGSDKRQLSALTWIVIKEQRACNQQDLSEDPRPPLSCNLGWSGTRTLWLDMQRVSAGSSPLQTVTGVRHLPIDDLLLVCLSGGAIYAIHHISSGPSWVPEDNTASRALTHVARQVFIKTQPRNVKFEDVNQINGLLPLSLGGSLIWLHEHANPTNLDYAYEGKHELTLVAATLWQSRDDEYFFIQQLSLALKSANPNTNTDIEVNESFSPPNTMTRGAVRLEFRKSLMRYLFNSRQLLNLRMRLTIVDVMMRSFPEYPDRRECEKLESQYFDAIFQMSSCQPGSKWFLGNDVPFILRLVHLAGNLKNSLTEVQNLVNKVFAALSSAKMVYTTPEEISRETCVACGSLILLGSGAQSICENAHSWGMFLIVGGWSIR
ncbi:hypothetical protein H0H92_013785 [Tricholoma furcatifolium]|nr:hypothetical protein H0H92_013785 [Tricholoma furcatifolium]